MRNKEYLVYVMLVSALMVVANALAYEVVTHSRITILSFSRSTVFADPVFMWELGLAVDPDSNPNTEFLIYPFNEEFEQIGSPVDALTRGVILEDEGKRPINHFFDPISTGTIPVPFENPMPSPDWTLEDEAMEGQMWSYRDFIPFYYAGLLAPTGDEARNLFGRAFRSLGHMVHHVQDMAQPQHSRLDPHCSEWYCRIALRYEPSFYEWLSAAMSNGGLQNAQGALVVGASDQGSYPNVNLYQLRDYWTQSSDMGMADYSNRGFVTADTNFVLDDTGNVVTAGFPSPGLIDWQEVSLDGTQITLFDGNPLPGELTLIRAPITDNYLATEQEWTHDTTTETLLAADIRAAIDDGVPPERFEGHNNRFYLNRFNYESANRHLFQRAIGYTAGFIDHVFRGRIEIKPPEGGIYAIVDHAVTKYADADPPVGFTSIKLKFRNGTPQQDSPDPQVVSEGHIVRAGTLVAVALYRPNPCYEADLSGEMHENANIPSDCSVQQWQVTEQHRVVSAEIPVSAGDIDTLDYTEKTFDFSANPIPINARDLSIQLVFRGELGGDEDAIAVGRKDISEPTWLGGLASRDIIGVDGVFMDTESFLVNEAAEDWGIDTTEERELFGVKGIVSVRYSNAANGQALAAPDPLPLYGYHRLAVLAEPGELLTINSVIHYDDWVGNSTLWMTPIETYLEEEPVLVEIPGAGFQTILQRQWSFTPVYSYRGARGLLIQPFYVYVGTPPTMEAIWALPEKPGILDPEPIPLL